MDDATAMDTPHETNSARLRRSAGSLGPFDYGATVALLAVFVVGTSMDDGPDTSIDFYRAVATVIPTLLITVAIQGRIFELSRKVTFRHQYRTVLFIVVVFGGEAGTLMTIARDKTNWAAHLYVYMAVLALGLAMVYLALAGTERAVSVQAEEAPHTDERGPDS
jgi:DMSO reductase anchor subunit